MSTFGGGHVCGLYYILPPEHRWQPPRRVYLPQVHMNAHTTILSSTSRTLLEQVFVNPSSEKGIKETRYTFPLYDGVSVVGFTCRVDDRVIKGVVKEKERARADFKEAVARGETAGLLEQLPDASDCFTTTIGNITPGAKVVVEITYLGELKHDAEVDGLRFTIPTSISPRYGNLPGELCSGSATPAQGQGGMQITVDAIMDEGSHIREVRSPSHTLAVSMGTVSTAKDDNPSFSKASATLSLGGAELDKDFVLQIVAKDLATPQAMLETHPTIPGQRALMTTLVPKFSLPPARPEIVFICDRSGSMGHDKIEHLKTALRVFLKSLPVGVKFNICSFGSSYSFLWPRSESYSQKSLDQAMSHVDTFQSDYGGTEMFEPIKETLNRRYQDMELEVFLVTDGQIWRQEQIFDYLNHEIVVKGVPVRVFTLGIGSAVSHSLIEGIARAGHGFSQAVGDDERLDKKVVRMLKAALTPHVKDYSLEVEYGQTTGDDDFEIVEKVTDSLKVQLDLSDNTQSEKQTSKPLSLFDPSADPDKDHSAEKSATEQDKYAHLPAIATPKLLQAPNIIPPLFPFIRTSVYLLLSAEATQKTPKSVILRGTCSTSNGTVPLELKIPVQALQNPGETIHQLAAKKAVAELEEGRGWLTTARDSKSGNLLKEAYDGRFSEMIEREAVRLGVQYQVGGKWCSFVAVEEHNKEDHATAMKDKEDYDFLDGETLRSSSSTFVAEVKSHDRRVSGGGRDRLMMASVSRPHASDRGGTSRKRQARMLTDQFVPHSAVPPPPPAPASRAAPGVSMHRTSEARDRLTNSQGLFARTRSAAYNPTISAYDPTIEDAIEDGSREEFSASPRSGYPGLAFSSPAPSGGALMSVSSSSVSAGSALFGASQPDSLHTTRARKAKKSSFSLAKDVINKFQPRRASKDADKEAHDTVDLDAAKGGHGVSQQQEKKQQDILWSLVSLQTFEGSWIWSQALLAEIGVSEAKAQAIVSQEKADKNAVATALTIIYLESKLSSEKETWEVLVDKAKVWLEEEVGGEDAMERILKAAKNIF